MFSGFLFLKTFLGDKNTFLFVYSIILVLISISLELGQLFGIRSGTFDILDIVTIIIFSYIGLSIKFLGAKHEKI